MMQPVTPIVNAQMVHGPSRRHCAITGVRNKVIVKTGSFLDEIVIKDTNSYNCII